MARSNLNAVETETDTNENWFMRGARQAGLYVRNGEVYGQTDGHLFVVPAPESCEAAAAFLAYSLVKFAEYRIGQTTGGDLNEATAKFVADLANYKPARTADAGEIVYSNTVEQRVRDAIVDANGDPISDDTKIETLKTWVVPQTGDNGQHVFKLANKGDSGAFALSRIIEAACDQYRASAFDRVIEAAIERGKNKAAKPASTGPGRGKRSGSTPQLAGLFS